MLCLAGICSKVFFFARTFCIPSDLKAVMSDHCALSQSDKPSYEAQNASSPNYSKAQVHCYGVEMGYSKGKEENTANKKLPSGAGSSGEEKSVWDLQDDSEMVNTVKHTFESDEKEFEAQTNLLE